ncbi:MAG: universal stress protein [Syntrophomonadaceae bacterium]
MYKKILVPTDGSPTACAAAAFACELLAGGVAGSVTLLVVGSIAKAVKENRIVNPTPADEDMIKAKLRKAARQVLSQTRRSFEERGVVVEEMLRMDDDPADCIAEIARGGGYELIVMGNRGRSPVKELLMGSVSSKVMQISPCPVVIFAARDR